MIEIIERISIQEKSSNLGIYSQELFRIRNNQYKIEILSESNELYSYASLYQWTSEGFKLIISKNPKLDYNVLITRSDKNWKNNSIDYFVDMHDKLKFIATKFEGHSYPSWSKFNSLLDYLASMKSSSNKQHYNIEYDEVEMCNEWLRDMDNHISIQLWTDVENSDMIELSVIESCSKINDEIIYSKWLKSEVNNHEFQDLYNQVIDKIIKYYKEKELTRDQFYKDLIGFGFEDFC